MIIAKPQSVLDRDATVHERMSPAIHAKIMMRATIGFALVVAAFPPVARAEHMSDGDHMFSWGGNPLGQLGSPDSTLASIAPDCALWVDMVPYKDTRLNNNIFEAAMHNGFKQVVLTLNDDH